MALVADSFHMLSDVIALIIAYVSVRMSPKKWRKEHIRMGKSGGGCALVNAVLIALCSISVEAIKRFLVIEPIEDPQLIIIVRLVWQLICGNVSFGCWHHGHSHGGGPWSKSWWWPLDILIYDDWHSWGKRTREMGIPMIMIMM